MRDLARVLAIVASAAASLAIASPANAILWPATPRASRSPEWSSTTTYERCEVRRTYGPWFSVRRLQPSALLHLRHLTHVRRCGKEQAATDCLR
jgi:hypothetical protein